MHTPEPRTTPALQLVPGNLHDCAFSNYSCSPQHGLPQGLPVACSSYIFQLVFQAGPSLACPQANPELIPTPASAPMTNTTVLSGQSRYRLSLGFPTDHSFFSYSSNRPAKAAPARLAPWTTHDSQMPQLQFWDKMQLALGLCEA